MKRGLRRGLVVAAGTAAILAGGSLLALRSGRPLYYTDGATEHNAYDLRDASMLMWLRPEPEAKLPGEVVGRTQTMPDGRIVFGQKLEDGTTDLVIADPGRPDLSPTPLARLNSRDHDLAPALGADGYFYFASDRRGGKGGFDLYRARFFEGVFGRVEPLPGRVNSPLDETDPAPDPSSTALAFVRRDPSKDNGRNGEILFAPAGLEPEPLFEQRPARTVDRDPRFSTDGVSLWFTRQAGDSTPAIWRTWRHQSVFAEPQLQSSFRRGGPFRSPEPLADGFSLRLLQQDGSLFRSEAIEVFPWWAGQRDLEWFLLAVLLFSLLLLALLLLGQRWHKLDVLTWCLLLSALLHLLLWLWLSRVEIQRQLLPAPIDDGRLEVLLVSSNGQGTDAALDVAQRDGDIAQASRFRGHERELAPPIPDGAAAAAPRRAVEAAEPTFERALDETMAPVDAAALADDAEAVPQKELVDAPAADLAAAADGQQAPERVELTAMDEGRNLASPSAERLLDSADDQRPAAAAPTAADSGVARALPDAARPEFDAALSDRAPTADPTAVADAMAAVPTRAAAAAPAASVVPTERGQATTVAAADVPAVQRVGIAAPSAAALGAVTPTKSELDRGRASAVPERSSPRPSATSARSADAAAAPTAKLQDGPQAAQPTRGATTTPRASLAAADRLVDVSAGSTGDAVSASRSVRSAERSANRAVRPAEPDVRRAGAAPRRGARSPVASSRPTGRTAAPPTPLSDAPTADAVAKALGGQPAARRSTRPGPAPVGVASPQSVSVAASPRVATGARGPSEAARPTVRVAAAELARPGRSVPTRRGGRRSPRRSTTRQSARTAAPSLRDAAAAPTGARGMAEARSGRTRTAKAVDIGGPQNAEDSATPSATREEAENRRASLRVAGSSLGRAGRSVPRRGRRGPRRLAGGLRSPVGDALVVDRAATGANTNGERSARGGATPGGDSPRDRSTGSVLQPLPLMAAAAPAVAETPDVARRGVVARGGRDSVGDAGVRLPSSLLTGAPRRSVAVRARGLAARQPVVIARAPTVFDNRFGPKKTEALEKFGGTKETEAAVQKGLAYLAQRQNEDGSWGTQQRRRFHPKYGEVHVGKSALCVLAFLGAGHTHQSDTQYSDVVRKALAFLQREQGGDGHFGTTSSYSHGISTYALAECYGMTRDGTLRPALVAGLNRILATQNRGRDRRSHGGWGYFSNRLDNEDRFSRASVSVWMIMALESAKLAGVSVPEHRLESARGFFERLWNARRGYFHYNLEPGRLSSDWPTLPASTPASVFALQLLGVDPTDARLRVAMDWTLDRRPRRYRAYSDDQFVLRGAGNVYFWYYGSLACFLTGGDTWTVWNESLKKVLPDAQANDGSFRPIGPYARYAGDTDRDRCFTTAMCVLSLEVYYRYLTPLLRPK